jgi:hypothetical protein
VYCARTATVEASPLHADAEARFAASIADGFGQFGQLGSGVAGSFCLWIRTLDDDVSKGRVRPLAAAHLASLFHHTRVLGGGTNNVTLLYVVLRHCFEDICTGECLCKVLTWGTCPTVVLAPNTDSTPSLCYSTAVDMARWWKVLKRFHRGKEVSERVLHVLFAFGSVPWYVYNLVDHGPSSSVITRFLMEPYEICGGIGERIPLTRQRAQWRRWHARHHRRQWVASGMPNFCE